MNTHSQITCMVTGAAGFIGSNLVRRLITSGYKVIALDNLFSGKLDNLVDIFEHPDFFFINSDIREENCFKKIIQNYPDISIVFHLAAIVSVPYSLEFPEETEAVNYHAAKQLYNDARCFGIRKFIYAGSAAEYGDIKKVPVDEDAIAEPISPYGEQKLKITKIIVESGWGASLRFFNIYGQRQDASNPYSGVVTQFIDTALSGKALTIYGDGQQTRDFIYIDDAIDAYMIIANLGEDVCNATGVYNVGSGEESSINNLAIEINRLTNNKRENKYKKSVEGDIKNSCAAIDKITDIGFKPTVNLQTGLKRVIDAYRLSGKKVI